MKKIQFFCFIILLLTAGITVSAFSPNNEINATTISGRINLDENYEAFLVFNNANRTGEKDLTVPLDENGSFSFRFDLTQPEFLTFIIIPKARDRQIPINFPVYMKPGNKEFFDLSYDDSTLLSINGKKPSGANRALVQYSNFRFLKQREMYFNTPSFSRVGDFLMQYPDTAKELISKFKLKNHTVGRYLQAWAMNDYIQNLGEFDKRYKRSKEEKLPEQLYTFVGESISAYEQPEAMLLNNTFNSLRKYISMQAEGKSPGMSGVDLAGRKIDMFDTLFSDSRLKTMFNYSELDEYVRSLKTGRGRNLEKEEVTFKCLVEKVDDRNLQEALLKSFSNTRYTREGAAAPEVSFKSAAGNEISFESLRGQYIYIDMWASWCVPCIAEVPNLKKLEKDYSDKNIAFVSISIDLDKNAWKNKMKELSLTGYQWETSDSDFENIMNIQGIPHFLLYDTEGKLMLYKAPRPSSTVIREIFDSL